MHTKRKIQQLLVHAHLRPNTHLGQHFLTDLNLMRLLVKSAELVGSEIVLEVGCGTGSLTQVLAKKACRLIAVELDKTLASIASVELARHDNVELITGNILQNKNELNSQILQALHLARQNCPGPIVLVSNLPYNVASPVIVNLLSGPVVAERMVVTVQKEVAERMTAQPASKDYGLLTVYLAAFGTVRRIRNLPASAFWPRPKVRSTMIRFDRDQNKIERLQNQALFAQLARLLLTHRRKTLKNCVRLVQRHLPQIDNWLEIFETCSIDPAYRPDQLTVEQYIALANYCNQILQSR